jgi:hypothetical protein
MLPLIAKEYAPYDKLLSFLKGFDAYGRTWDNPYEGVDAQAWDRGLECAARTQRWLDQNVGWD